MSFPSTNSHYPKGVGASQGPTASEIAGAAFAANVFYVSYSLTRSFSAASAASISAINAASS